MRSGIYGIFRLDRGPIDAGNRALLGLGPDPDCLNLAGVDNTEPVAISIDRDGADIAVFAGYLDEREDLAALLGLAPDTPPARIACAALRRFGDDAPAKMTGEWSFAWWQSEARLLTLATARGCRDPLLYAAVGSHVAIAPDLRLLSRLPWVDDRLDAEGMLFALGRAQLRRHSGNRTILGDVKQVEQGTCVRISADGIATGKAVPLAVPPRFTGSSADALAEAEALLRRAMKQRLARSPAPGSLISGGLDSSIVAWLIAEECQDPNRVPLLCSAAGPGSGLADETKFAQIVADHLGMAMDKVVPQLLPSIYRPCASDFADANGPSLSVRHYLYGALADQAQDRGLTTVFDGCFGELSITGYRFFPGQQPGIGKWLRAIRSLLFPPQRWIDPAGDFHVALSQDRLASLPESITGGPPSPEIQDSHRSASDQLGYVAGMEKCLLGSTAMAGSRIRWDYPLRDTRLLELAASWPAAFLDEGGLDRAMARNLLKGRLPDSIRLRPKGMAFSPDYHQRLHRQAGDALQRLPFWRAAGADEWLNLQWLQISLSDPANADPFKLQVTAIAAEFLVWWREPEL